MEASVDLSSPKKALRPAYKALWKDACASLDKLEADYVKMHNERESYRMVAIAKEDANTTANTALRRWATVAIIEALVLILLAMR